MYSIQALVLGIVFQSAVTADTLPPKPPSAVPEATARVTFDFGAGSAAPITVRGFEASFTGSPALAAQGGGSRVRFTKAPDSLTAELARRGATGQRFPSVLIEVLDANAKPVLTLRLGDVTVASAHLTIGETGSALEQQRLNAQDAVAQQEAELAEAERQLKLNEALDRKRATSSLEVARAKERVELVRGKLALQRRRLGILERQIASHHPVAEEVTLAFGRFEIVTSEGARTVWGTDGRASGAPARR